MEAMAPAPGDRLITQQATRKASQVWSAMADTSINGKDRPLSLPLRKTPAQYL
ncbi:hypothetical protein D9M68_894020 [compost metagenome]